MGIKIYRIERTWGRKNHINYVDHADVYADTPDEVLQAAQNNRIFNWRRIDSFDKSDQDYCEYNVMEEVILEKDAKKPGFPLPNWMPTDRPAIFREIKK